MDRVKETKVTYRHTLKNSSSILRGISCFDELYLKNCFWTERPASYTVYQRAFHKATLILTLSACFTITCAASKFNYPCVPAWWTDRSNKMLLGDGMPGSSPPLLHHQAPQCRSRFRTRSSVSSPGSHLGQTTSTVRSLLGTCSYLTSSLHATERQPVSHRWYTWTKIHIHKKVHKWSECISTTTQELQCSTSNQLPPHVLPPRPLMREDITQHANSILAFPLLCNHNIPKYTYSSLL